MIIRLISVFALGFLLAACGGSSPQQSATPLSFASSSSAEDRVQALYVAYYGRPADPDGLRYWAERVRQNPSAQVEVMRAFGASQEANELFGNMSHERAVTALYLQILGRLPDDAGRDFYVKGLQEGRFSLVSIAANILDGVPSQSTDDALMHNRLELARIMSERLASNLNEALSYSGPAAALAARNWLGTIASDAAGAKKAQEELPYVLAGMANRQKECIRPWSVTTKDKEKFAANGRLGNAKFFSDKAHFLDMQIWNPDGLEITIQMEGCLEREVVTAKYTFDVECCKSGSHASPYVSQGWRETLYAFNPTFNFMGGEKPKGKLPVRFDNMPKKLILDYDITTSNENGWWHITTEAWAFALTLDNMWRCCGLTPQPMDIHFWGTPEMKSNDKIVYDEYFTDYQGKTWGLKKEKYWNCDGNCPSYPYTILIALMNGSKKERVDVVPLFKRVVELGWVKSDYGLSNLNIGTEILNGNAEVTINRFQVIAE